MTDRPKPGMKECPACESSCVPGRIYNNNDPANQWSECPACNGTGEVPDDKRPKPVDLEDLHHSATPPDQYVTVRGELIADLTATRAELAKYKEATS